MIFEQLHKQTLSANEKFRYLEKIQREYMPLITPGEYAVLMFIYHRTILWGRLAEFIRETHFINGVFDAEKETLITGPVPMTPRNLVRVLQKLEGRNLIVREKQKYGSWYAINFEWNVVMLRTPKNQKTAPENRLKMSKKGGDKMSGGGVTKCQDRNTVILNTGKESRSGNPLQPSEDLSINESIVRAEGRTQAAKDRNKQRRLTNETPSGLLNQWQRDAEDLYPEMPRVTPSRKHVGQFKNFFNDYVRNNPGVAVYPFLEFCVTNWPRIAALKFNWKKDITVPEYPDIGFLIGFKKEFIAAYADKEFTNRQLRMTAREREVAKLVKLGYTQEQAEREVDTQVEKSKNVVKYKEAAERAKSDVKHWKRKAQELERRKGDDDIKRGIELMKEARKEKMNPGSKPERKVKYDADGFEIFEE